MLSRRPAVVAATPGRLWDLMSGGAAATGGGSSGGKAAPHLTRLDALDFLVLDEADRMVQQGHFQARPAALSPELPAKRGVRPCRIEVAPAGNCKFSSRAS